MAESKKLIRNESEAIECLRSNKPTSGYLMLQESIDMAIQALEKQIPKKPTYEGDGYAPDGTFVWDDFCPNCGQKIDWSDDDCKNG